MLKRFCNNPNLSHGKAVKHIIQYPKRKPIEGIVLHSDSFKGIQCFVDADFANGWNSADCEEPLNLYSWTADFPLVWASELHTKVTFITTEMECVAFSHVIRGFIPLLGLLEGLTPVLNLNKDQPVVYQKICGYDNVCIIYLQRFMKTTKWLMNHLKLHTNK
jgi:hypothetical protein